MGKEILIFGSFVATFHGVNQRLKLIFLILIFFLKSYSFAIFHLTQISLIPLPRVTRSLQKGQELCANVDKGHGIYNQDFSDGKEEYIYPDVFLQLHHKLPDLDTKLHLEYGNSVTQ